MYHLFGQKAGKGSYGGIQDYVFSSSKLSDCISYALRNSLSWWQLAKTTESGALIQVAHQGQLPDLIDELSK